LQFEYKSRFFFNIYYFLLKIVDLKIYFKNNLYKKITKFLLVDVEKEIETFDSYWQRMMRQDWSKKKYLILIG